MQKQITWLACFIIFFCSLLNIGWAEEKAANIQLNDLLKNIRTIHADFTQTILDSKKKQIQQSFGRMDLKRPGKFRWEVIKPMPQLIIATDNKLWIYDKDLEQVTIRSLKKTAGETPALLLSHENPFLDKDFTVKKVQNTSSANYQWFSLKPKSADSMFSSILMGFENNQIKEMQLVDHLGQTTTVKFSNILLNRDLPIALFVFKPPANVDVIDESKR